MAGGATFHHHHHHTPWPRRSHRPRKDPDGVSLTLPLRVLLRRGSLDRALAEAADPNRSPELSLRARQLQGARQRRTLADGIERTIEAAERAASKSGPALPVNRREVTRARSFLLQLCEQLRGPEVPAPRGLAMVRGLLTDDTSPIYSTAWSGAPVIPGALECRARAALEALDETGVDRGRAGRP